MKDLYIVTYYVWSLDFSESTLYEVMIGSESVCKAYIDKFDFDSDLHGYGFMPLQEYLDSTDLELDDVLYRMSLFV